MQMNAHMLILLMIISRKWHVIDAGLDVNRVGGTPGGCNRGVHTISWAKTDVRPQHARDLQDDRTWVHDDRKRYMTAHGDDRD